MHSRTLPAARPVSARHRAAAIASGATLLLMAMAAPASAATSTSVNYCNDNLVSFSVSAGRHDYAMTDVDVSAKDVTWPEGCSLTFSLNAYSADGPTWPTSGTRPRRP